MLVPNLPQRGHEERLDTRCSAAVQELEHSTAEGDGATLVQIEGAHWYHGLPPERAKPQERSGQDGDGDSQAREASTLAIRQQKLLPVCACRQQGRHR